MRRGTALTRHSIALLVPTRNVRANRGRKAPFNQQSQDALGLTETRGLNRDRPEQTWTSWFAP